MEKKLEKVLETAFGSTKLAQPLWVIFYVLNFTPATLSAVTGIPAQRLSLYRRGIDPTKEHLEQFEELLEECYSIIENFKKATTLPVKIAHYKAVLSLLAEEC